MSLTTLLPQAIFWTCALALVHSYVVYPALVRRLARRRARRAETPATFSADDPEADWPYLAVVMAAHNEEAVIGDTLRSILAVDYPRDRFEVLVAADNCSDLTHDIVRSFQDRHPRLTLRIFQGRNGKIRVINQLMAEHRERLARFGDHVIISCDANVRWSPDLPRQLARHFRDPRIGLVATNVLDSRRDHDGIADEEEAYINRENEIKHAEGVLWGRTMGAFGACYAIRGRLFEPVPETFIVDDFFSTMRCFELGYDAIVEPGAVCYEDVSEDIAEEFRRKRRIAIGNFQNLVRFRRLLLLPRPGGVATAFAFWSHKGFRWLGPFLLLGALASSLVLAPVHPLYALALAGQLALMTIALVDGLLAPRGIHLKPLRFARYFYLMNLALMLGAFRFLAGVRSSVWEPTRRVPAASPAPPAPPASPEKKPDSSPTAA